MASWVHSIPRWGELRVQRLSLKDPNIFRQHDATLAIVCLSPKIQKTELLKVFKVIVESEISDISDVLTTDNKCDLPRTLFCSCFRYGNMRSKYVV